MAEQELDFADLDRRMAGAISSLKGEFVGLRTGRASAGILEPVQVEAYGSMMPLDQVGTIGVPESRMLTVQVWDKALVGPTKKRSGQQVWVSILLPMGSSSASPFPR